MKLTDIAPSRERENESTAGVFAAFFRNRPIPGSEEGPRLMVGQGHSDGLVRWYRRLGWGRMFSETRSYHFDGEPWGFDNGAWHAAHHDEDCPEQQFRARLRQDLIRGEVKGTPPTVAVVPDILWGGMESLAYSLDWIDDLKGKAPE